MRDPIAYTYDADTHCPRCTVARYGTGRATFGGPAYLPDVRWARDSEGNPVGAIAPWDEGHEADVDGWQTLVCGTCADVIDTCYHGIVHDDPDPEPATKCMCDSCVGGAS